MDVTLLDMVRVTMKYGIILTRTRISLLTEKLENEQVQTSN